MKGKLLFIFLVSIALNVLLLIGCWIRFHPERRLETIPASVPSSLPEAAIIRTNTIVVTNAPAALDWRAVESEDYKKYIANLRAIGCPEKPFATSSSPT